MARTFTITCAAGTIRLAGAARGECAFTVTNSTATAVRAHAAPIPLDPRAQGWFGVVGEPVRELAPGQTVQVSVAILPTGAPPGRYGFRLDVMPADGGERSTGPEVCVELTSEAPPVAPGRRPFPWWILVLVAVLLVVIAVVLWLLLGGHGDAAPAGAKADPAAPTEAGAAAPVAAAPAASGGKAAAGEVEALAERWRVAFEKEDLKGLVALTSAPALIANERADDERAITSLYSTLLRQGRPTALRIAPATTPARPVRASVRDLGGKLPPEARKLGLGDDDHALGVTLHGSDLKFVLLIRNGPPPRIAGVLR